MVIIILYRFVPCAIDQPLQPYFTRLPGTRIGRVRQAMYHVVVRSSGFIIILRLNVFFELCCIDLSPTNTSTISILRKWHIKPLKSNVYLKKRISTYSREEQHRCGIVTISYRSNDLRTAFPHTG